MVAKTDLYWFLEWSALKLSDFYVFLENDSTNLRQFFFIVQAKTLAHYPAMKNTAPDL